MERQKQSSTDKCEPSTVSLSLGALQKPSGLQRFRRNQNETQSCMYLDEPSCFLCITGTNGEDLDEGRLFEFFDRALDGNSIVQCEYRNGQAILQMSHVIYAEHAYHVLSGKQLSRSGGPIKVRYIPDWSSTEEIGTTSDTRPQERVKGHNLKARLSVHNTDFNKRRLRKQREALVAHIEETKMNIHKEIQEKMKDSALHIANTHDDVLRQTFQHKLDESQAFYDQFTQTSTNISKQLDSLTSDESLDCENQTYLTQLVNLSRNLEREGRRLTNPLPIYGSKTQIVKEITDKETKACVIQGETGSGKSTQVPQYLMEYINQQNISVSSSGVGKGIVCTQPRRVAAITLAQRIAEEYGCDVGQEVGYITGNNKKVSENTIATFMTDRALLSKCLLDPKYLDKYKYVVIDEAHERSVDTDILIAMLKKEQQQNRHITIVIMSATIDVDLFSTYFDGCPVITIPGRTFPVEVEWCGGGTEGQGTSSDNYVSRAVQKSYDIHVNEDTQGDILVFLTSQNEIDRACHDLKRQLGITEEDNEGVDIFPLHGKLQPQDQFKVFKKTPRGRRKIVFFHQYCRNICDHTRCEVRD